LQVIDSGGQLSGSMVEIFRDKPGHWISQNGRIAGTISGSQVNLLLAVTSPFFGDSKSLSGQVQGNQLILQVPQVDGSLQPVTFVSRDATTYNSAVQHVKDVAAQ
jgi:hypothetical protein